MDCERHRERKTERGDSETGRERDVQVLLGQRSCCPPSDECIYLRAENPGESPAWCLELEEDRQERHGQLPMRGTEPLPPSDIRSTLISPRREGSLEGARLGGMDER
uniref:Uncharacterized protein n=1 Tax=Chromera velia CCMP2878 TaxID=1169474 RepID=A0A0G4I1D7_9ALVE|eukprot:Cvel_10127.t1-p1 / transcript=Cvel_10127.t1 / gene=Cvel_10127 / organism=Chromera_velia_CCMP2878 / gene_product=hypothetical protein / transcript_product=hypothetical protein / location=Cvel_scaffold604:1502-2040(+) / protein_length=106 / sequence_SO=supercontig / SO=protein_coding / is_pseudo=false